MHSIIHSLGVFVCDAMQSNLVLGGPPEANKHLSENIFKTIFTNIFQEFLQEFFTNNNTEENFLS